MAEIIERHYVMGQPYKTICFEMSLKFSIARAQQIAKDGLELLKKWMEEKNGNF